MMTIEEIANYIATGSRSLVCIFRETLETLGLFVVSFYIMGKHGAYILSVEFDPIDMVDDGEGWIWQSEPMELSKLVGIIEQYLEMPISDWENITKTGRLAFHDKVIDNEEYQAQERIFTNELRFGEVLLPCGVVWVNRPD
jgi:hypothetical protein